MNTQTYEIVPENKIPEKDKNSGKWIKLNEEQNKELKLLTRKQRREYLKNNGMFKNGKWGWR